MKIEIVNPKDLEPYEKNPRINDQAVEKVAASIEQFGFNQPLVINQDGIICVGHTRWKAALELGLKTVPVYRRKMTEAEFVAYNLADNKTGELAKWDNELLADLMRELDDVNADLIASTGFNEKELGALLDDDDLDKWFDEEKQSPEEKDNQKGASDRSAVRMVQIFFSNESFGPFIEKCELLQKKYGTENLTDTVAQAVRESFENHYPG